MSNYRVYNRTVHMKHIDADYICVCLDGPAKLKERFPAFFEEFVPKLNIDVTSLTIYLGHAIMRKSSSKEWWIYALDTKPTGERYRGSDRSVLLTDRLGSEQEAIAYVDKLMETALPYWEAVKHWPVIVLPVYVTRQEEYLLRNHPDGFRKAMRKAIVSGLMVQHDYRPVDAPSDPFTKSQEHKKTAKPK